MLPLRRFSFSAAAARALSEIVLFSFIVTKGLNDGVREELADARGLARGLVRGTAGDRPSFSIAAFPLHAMTEFLKTGEAFPYREINIYFLKFYRIEHMYSCCVVLYKTRLHSICLLKV